MRSNLALSLSALKLDDRTTLRTLALWRVVAKPGDFDDTVGMLNYARVMIHRYGICR